MICRKMNNEIRIKQRHLFFISLGAFLVIYLIVSNSCSDKKDSIDEISPIIYCITPTHTRPVQKAELTRLSHTFLLIPNLFWVIVEDSEKNTQLVKNLLNNTGLSKRSVLLHAKTPTDFKLGKNDPHWKKARGVAQRNAALAWVKRKLTENPSRKSIIYFMDDDNTYSTQLFKEMFKIEQGRVGVWPVGLVGALNVEKPIVKNNKVIGFNSMWRPERPFPIDMAGFGISGDLFIKNPLAEFSYEVERGYQESEILRHLTTREELQPLAVNNILVWHTRTENPKLTNEEKLSLNGKPPSDQEFLV